jgi:hypothetical protein
LTADSKESYTKTIIKDSKGSGGIVGITNQKSALVRWTLTRYFLASFSGAMNDRAGMSFRESTVNKVSALFFFTFVDSRQQRILYFSGSMHAGRNIHETWRVGLYIKRERALVLANSRDDVTIDNILSHPVGPIPVSMFHEDDTMRKSCKSDLVKQFENEASPAYEVTKQVYEYQLVFFDR